MMTSSLHTTTTHHHRSPTSTTARRGPLSCALMAALEEALEGLRANDEGCTEIECVRALHACARNHPHPSSHPFTPHSLSYMRIGYEGVRALGEALKTNTVLSALWYVARPSYCRTPFPHRMSPSSPSSLPHCAILDFGCAALSDGLRANTSLTLLKYVVRVLCRCCASPPPFVPVTISPILPPPCRLSALCTIPLVMSDSRRLRKR